MKITYLLIILFSLPLISCSDNLSNSKAEKIISKCLDQKPEQRSVAISLRKKVYSEQSKKDLAKYQQLQEEGFLEIKPVKKDDAGSNDPITKWRNQFDEYDISITKNGEKFINKASENSEIVMMKTFRYEVDKVLEVQEIPAANSAKVKVQYKATDITPFASLSNKDPSEYWVKNRTMKKTSNGWKYCDNN